MVARAWARATMFGLMIGALGSACSRTQIDFGDAPGAAASGGVGPSGGAAGVGAEGGASGIGNGGVSGGGSSGDGGSGNVSGAGGGGGAGSCEGQAEDECDFCTCDACFGEWEACTNDPGCDAILDCADQSGCSGVECYLGPCQQVIDDNGGPFGDSSNLAQNVGECRSASSCPCEGGSGGAGGAGGAGGVGGFGGAGGAGGNGGSGGSGGSGPLACFNCVTQQCPEVGQCLLDDVCRNGMICTLQSCLGSGTPNFQCVLGCFDGDLQAAFEAFQAFQCFISNCADDCQGSIPGFPGGGGGFPGGGSSGSG